LRRQENLGGAHEEPDMSVSGSVRQPLDVRKEGRMTDREKKIRDEAYRLWHEAGRPEGQDDKHWLEAERSIRDAEANESPKKSRKATQPLKPLEKKPAKPGSDKKNAQAAISAIAKTAPAFESGETPKSVAEEPPVSAAGPAADVAAKRAGKAAGGKSQPDLTPAAIATAKGKTKGSDKPSKPKAKR
jgi:hypothetical protein